MAISRIRAELEAFAVEIYQSHFDNAAVAVASWNSSAIIGNGFSSPSHFNR